MAKKKSVNPTDGQAHSKRIADQIRLMTYEALVCPGEYNLDRNDDDPAIDAALNMARILRMVMDKLEKVETKGGRPVLLDNCRRTIVELREEKGLSYGQIAIELRRLNKDWAINGKPYGYKTIQKWYLAAAQNMNKAKKKKAGK